jgi:predicted ATP-grasp superfamily ATP-dependent carboligase
VASPLSFYARDIGEVATLDCRFPVILKPTMRESANAFTLAKAWRADDRAALLDRYEQAAALVGESAIVIQELIPGSGSVQFSHAGVWDRGQPVAALVARRSRQYPVDFGYTSTFVETVENADVEAAACRFLGALGFSGLAEAEFKYDVRDGRYKLLDVNARVWTWAALGGAAGVDFPILAWRIAAGESVAPVRASGRAAWVHGSRDLVAACQEMLAGNLSPSRYVASFRQKLVFAAYASDDPLPGIVDLPLVFGRALTRRLPVAARAAFGHLATPLRPSH